jgi:hypothetical protein
MEKSPSCTVNNNSADHEILCLFGTQLSIIMFTKASQCYVYSEPDKSVFITTEHIFNPLRAVSNVIYVYKSLIPTSQRTQCKSIKRTKWIMLYLEITVVCFGKYMKNKIKMLIQALNLPVNALSKEN